MNIETNGTAKKTLFSLGKLIAWTLAAIGIIAVIVIFVIISSFSGFTPVHDKTIYEGGFTASDGSEIKVRVYITDPDFLAKYFCELTDPDGNVTSYRLHGTGTDSGADYLPLDYRAYKTRDETFIWVCKHNCEEIIRYKKEGEFEHGFTYTENYRTDEQKKIDAPSALRIAESGFIDTLPARCDKARFKEYLQQYSKYIE